MGPKPSAKQLVAPPADPVRPPHSDHMSKMLKNKVRSGLEKNPKCHVTKKNGEPCRNYALTGLTVCLAHGGKTKASLAKSRRITAKKEADLAIRRELKKLEKLGGRLDVDPLDAMLEQVGEAAANVEVLRSYISGLNVEVDSDGAIAMPDETIYYDKGGTHVQARVHIMVTMYNEERDRLVRYSKMCIDAGVDERRVRVAELQAQRLGQAFAAALEDVRSLLTPEAVEGLKEALARRLRALGGG